MVWVNVFLSYSMTGNASSSLLTGQSIVPVPGQQHVASGRIFIFQDRALASRRVGRVRSLDSGP